ncbi:MAG TPA: EamA family transporter RarD [Gammaproteobacteria bacterium]|nr:EamA family transporter RarD [Gammaproteobacteria bacterium]
MNPSPTTLPFVASQTTHNNLGLGYALFAYSFWGLVPIFFKQLAFADAPTIIAHRIIWSVFFLTLVLLFKNGWSVFRQFAALGKNLWWLALNSLLIASNWLIFVWAVNQGRILETSLGYFITPLISIILGVLFLGERLRGFERIAIALAATGTAYLAVGLGHLPWISLALALLFGFYGLVKKRLNTGALHGLFLETGFLLTPALGFLLLYPQAGNEYFFDLTIDRQLLLASSGLATCIPLLAFAGAARRLPLSMLGFMQYLAPTLSMLVAVFIYDEPFTQTHLIVFSLIWAGLVIYSTGNFLRASAASKQRAQLSIEQTTAR